MAYFLNFAFVAISVSFVASAQETTTMGAIGTTIMVETTMAQTTQMVQTTPIAQTSTLAPTAVIQDSVAQAETDLTSEYSIERFIEELNDFSPVGFSTEAKIPEAESSKSKSDFEENSFPKKKSSGLNSKSKSSFNEPACNIHSKLDMGLLKDSRMIYLSERLIKYFEKQKI